MKSPFALNRPHQLLKFHGVGGKGANAFGQLFGRHRIVIERVAGWLRQNSWTASPAQPQLRRPARAPAAHRWPPARPQLGADGQQVTARQGRDLADVAKTRAHDFGGNASVLVVVVDFAHRLHTGVMSARIRGFVPAAAGGFCTSRKSGPRKAKSAAPCTSAGRRWQNENSSVKLV